MLGRSLEPGSGGVNPRTTKRTTKTRQWLTTKITKVTKAIRHFSFEVSCNPYSLCSLCPLWFVLFVSFVVLLATSGRHRYHDGALSTVRRRVGRKVGFMARTMRGVMVALGVLLCASAQAQSHKVTELRNVDYVDPADYPDGKDRLDLY